MENRTNSCRSCMTKADAFSYFIYEHISPKDYFYCTSIEVKCDDDLPRAICDDCYTLLCQFINFKAMCVLSNKELIKCSNSLLVKKEPSESESIFELEIEGLTLKREGEIELQPMKVWSDLKTLKKDDTNVVGDNGNNSITADAQETQVSTEHTQAPTVRKDTLGSKVKSRKVIVPLPKNYMCELCNRKFSYKEHFEGHLLMHEGKTASTECKICNKTYATKWGLRNHTRVYHTPYTFKETTCQLCSKVFKTPNTLRTHMKTHEKGHERVCEECGKTLKSDVTFKTHLLTHIKNRERNIVCKHCGVKYINKKTLERHVARRHTNNQFICDYCSFKFTDKANIIRHIMLHEGTHPKYKCDTCLKSFTSKPYLKVHKRMHTGEKPFSCSYCSKSYADRAWLVEHERSHTGEKPFQCTVCAQNFSRRGSMKRHMKVHT